MRISDWSSDVCSSDLLGAALAMQTAGLSMAMGAFLAGVLLSESSFRHQLEADVEPFRGVLLGLFFLGVGIALDLAIVAANQIGLASCSESVCQSVLFSFVSFSFINISFSFSFF